LPFTTKSSAASAKEEKDAWHWDFLWGLVGRSGRGEERRWRYLWFFGGDRLDAE